MLLKYVLIFLGSGLGGILRFALSGLAQRITQANFPVGTILVNILGCLAAGFLASAFAVRFELRDELRVALMVGFLGGFTTFSAFSLETLALFHQGRQGMGVVNVIVSVGAGLAAVWIGYGWGAGGSSG